MKKTIYYKYTDPNSLKVIEGTEEINADVPESSMKIFEVLSEWRDSFAKEKGIRYRDLIAYPITEKDKN